MVLKDFTADNFSVTKQKVNLSLEHALVACKRTNRFFFFLKKIRTIPEPNFVNFQ